MIDEYIYNEADALYWAKDRMPGHNFRSDAHTVTRFDKNYVRRGVVIWDTFSTNNCFISVASDGSRSWFSRGFAIHATAYPFIQCGFARISALVSADNEASLVFVTGFGFKLEGKMRQGGMNGEDLMLFGLLRDEWERIPWTKYRPATLPAAALAV